MTIQLSDHFTIKRLLRFTVPSIIMMVFTSIYGVVDGYFVSNFVGKTPFAAVNFIYPFIMILGTVGFMFGTGGSALVSKTMGEGDTKKANEIFSLLVYASLISGIVITVLGQIFLRPAAIILGAEGQLLEDSVLYGRIILSALPAFVLQMAFQSFFVTAEKPKLGLVATVAAGVTNMALDALLVAVIPLGLVGAALATALSQVVGGVFPIIYFSKKNDSPLRITKTKFDLSALLKTCANGSSELMSNISMSLVSMLYNIQLLKYAGENGIAAYGVMMYVNFVFISIFIGYSIGSAPVIGYHFGARNHSELRGLLKKSLGIVSIASVLMVALALALSRPMSGMFVGYDEELFEMTLRGFKVFSASFLFAGFAIFSSGFFTALSDGLTSAIISFLRTLVFQIAAVMLLPLIWELDGIWISIIVAEAMAVAVSAIFMVIKKKKFGY